MNLVKSLVDQGDRAQIKDGHIFIMGRVDKALHTLHTLHMLHMLHTAIAALDKRR